MFLKNSRYKAGVVMTCQREGETESFSGIRPREIPSLEGVIEHLVAEGDRLDLLARYYYNNDRLWYRIADANPDVVFSGYLVSPEMKGKVILIPAGGS